MSDTAVTQETTQAQPQRFTVNLELLKNSMTNVRAGLNKACKAGLFELDEAQALGTNMAYLSEVCDVVEKIAVRPQPQQTNQPSS